LTKWWVSCLVRKINEQLMKKQEIRSGDLTKNNERFISIFKAKEISSTVRREKRTIDREINSKQIEFRSSFEPFVVKILTERFNGWHKTLRNMQRQIIRRQSRHWLKRSSSTMTHFSKFLIILVCLGLNIIKVICMQRKRI